jgi:DNA-binding CsgD family transcriptional regulator
LLREWTLFGAAVAKTSENGVVGNGHPSEPLTGREREVLKCIAEGHSTKEVAEILGITFKTAACQRCRIMAKLGSMTRLTRSGMPFAPGLFTFEQSWRHRFK